MRRHEHLLSGDRHELEECQEHQGRAGQSPADRLLEVEQGDLDGGHDRQDQRQLHVQLRCGVMGGGNVLVAHAGVADRR